MKLEVLVGNIASGKSSYCYNHAPDCYVISRDAIRKAFVQDFYTYTPRTELQVGIMVEAMLKAALILKLDHVIVDETNMTVHSRAWILKLAKRFNVECTAVLFKDRGIKDHVSARVASPHGCNAEHTEELWISVYNKFKSRYQEPSKEEGFTSITTINKENI